MVWGLPRCVWARESTAPAQGNQPVPEQRAPGKCSVPRPGSPVPSTPERREGLRACYWEGPSELPERRSQPQTPPIMSLLPGSCRPPALRGHTCEASTPTPSAAWLPLQSCGCTVGQGGNPEQGPPRGREGFLKHEPYELGLDACVGVCSLLAVWVIKESHCPPPLHHPGSVSS